MNPEIPNASKATKNPDRLDQTIFQLDSVQMQAFHQALEEPALDAAASPGLVRLMAIIPPWKDQHN